MSLYSIANTYIYVHMYFDRYIHSTNRRDLTFKLAVNHMTDLSTSERKQMRGYRHTMDSPRGETFVMDESAAKVPEYFNWRLRGIEYHHIQTLPSPKAAYLIATSVGALCFVLQKFQCLGGGWICEVLLYCLQHLHNRVQLTILWQ